MPTREKEIRGCRDISHRKHRTQDPHHFSLYLSVWERLNTLAVLALWHARGRTSASRCDGLDVRTHRDCNEQDTRAIEKLWMIEALPDGIASPFFIGVQTHLRCGLSGSEFSEGSRLASVSNQNLRENFRNILVYVVIVMDWTASVFQSS